MRKIADITDMIDDFSQSYETLYKVVFAGVYGVGKTSLFKRMFKLGFSDVKTTIYGEAKRTHKEILEDDETVIPVRLKSMTLCCMKNSIFTQLHRVPWPVSFGAVFKNHELRSQTSTFIWS